MNNRKEINEAQANEMFPNIMETLKDTEKILNNVYPVAVKTLDRYEGIKELLYDAHDGYYVVYKIVIDEGETTASAAISKKLIKATNTTEDEIKQHAWYNLTEMINTTAICKSMTSVLQELMPGAEELVELPDGDMMQILRLKNGTFQMSGILGNFELLRDTVFKMFPMADKVIILPSSIWEFILIPIEKSQPSVITENLTSIVEEVNGTEVDPNEQVADNAFLLTRHELQYI